MDNLKLIAAVLERREIWDTTINMRDRKTYYSNQWMQVAREMNTDVESVRRRWKGLRDHYRSEIRRIQKNRIKRSTWVLFNNLEFMRPVFDPENLVSFVPLSPNSAYPTDGEMFTDLTNEPITLDNDDSFGFDVISEDIFHQSSNNNGKTSITPPPTKKYKFTEEEVMTPLLVYEKQTTSSSINKEDHDYNFLVSLLPHMKSLTDMGKLKFRMEVCKNLMEIKQSELNAKAKTSYEAAAVSAPNRPYKANGVKILNGGTMSDIYECEVKIENEPIVN